MSELALDAVLGVLIRASRRGASVAVCSDAKMLGTNGSDSLDADALGVLWSGPAKDVVLPRQPLR